VFEQHMQDWWTQAGVLDFRGHTTVSTWPQVLAEVCVMKPLTCILLLLLLLC